ncbi:MAG: hypothetical protein O3A46_06155, partial [Candidatus Poribacteria bacterium]|nr:hypothetical protein [Candidatus Poribacteria bacterium]
MIHTLIRWTAITLLVAPILAFADPILLMTFDDINGDIVADGSGNGNDGTMEAAPKVVAGKFGDALSFSASRVALTASDTLSGEIFHESFTLTLWLNPARTGNLWQQLFRSHRTGGTNDTLFINNDGRLSWRGSVGGAWA